MKRLEFTCDGCDLVEHVVLPPGRGAVAELALDGWVAHRAVLHEGNAEPYEIFADLCPRCMEKMRHAINPANWPRIKAVTKEQGRKLMA
jgi:hypothetical protein